MLMLTRRMQLLIDELDYRLLAAEAERRHTSVAALVREAIKQALPENRMARRRAAMEAILAFDDPIDLPADPEDLKREIRETLRDNPGGYRE
jgi:hypothetical protein